MRIKKSYILFSLSLGSLFFNLAFFLYYSTLLTKFYQLRKQYETLLTQTFELSTTFEKVTDKLHAFNHEAISFQDNLKSFDMDRYRREQLADYQQTDLDWSYLTEQIQFWKTPQKASYVQTVVNNLERWENILSADMAQIQLSKRVLDSIPSIVPTNGRLNSFYGSRISPVSGRRKIHKGVDIVANKGTPVYAAADGMVRLAKKSGAYGNLVKVSHDFGFGTSYAHLSTMKVATGQEVRRGDVLGTVGQTGVTTGSHLHYEVWLHSHHINPVSFLMSSKTYSNEFKNIPLDTPSDALDRFSDEDEIVASIAAIPIVDDNQIIAQRTSVNEPLKVVSYSLALGGFFILIFIFFMFIKKIFSNINSFLKKVKKKRLLKKRDVKEPVQYWD